MTLHILVVDDDKDVLSVLVEILVQAEFAVTAADSGLAMRETLIGDVPRVDVVVLDCDIPGEPSSQLALHAKSLRLPVVMISGSMEAMQFADENGLQLLHKPFRLPGCSMRSTKQWGAASSASASGRSSVARHGTKACSDRSPQKAICNCPAG